MHRFLQRTRTAALLFLMAPPFAALAQTQDQAELTKKTQNPVADLISIPLPSNWDFGAAPDDATRYTLNVQPVLPFPISQNRRVAIRSIVPIIHAESPVPGAGGRVYVESPDGGPDWGLRFTVTFLFPR